MLESNLSRKIYNLIELEKMIESQLNLIKFLNVRSKLNKCMFKIKPLFVLLYFKVCPALGKTLLISGQTGIQV